MKFSNWILGMALSFVCHVAHADVTVVQVASLSGPNGADLGLGMQVGQRVVFDSVNESGGIAGQRIKLVSLDDRYDPKATVEQARRAIEQHDPVAFAGFRGTANTLALMESGLLKSAGIALVGTLTGADDVQRAENVFHTRTSYAREITRLAQLVEAVGSERVAIVSVDDAFGRAGRVAAETALRSGNKVTATAIQYEPKSADLKRALQDAAFKVKASAAQAVLVIAVGDAAFSFVAAMRDVDRSVQVYCLSVVSPALMVQRLGPLAEGVGFSQVFPLARSVPAMRDYLSLMKKHAPNEAPSAFGFEGFVNAKVLIDAMKRVNGKITRASVLAAMRAPHVVDLGGFKLQYDANSGAGSNFTELAVLGRDGRLLH